MEGFVIIQRASTRFWKKFQYKKGESLSQTEAMKSQILSDPESKFVIELHGQEEKPRNMHHLFVLKPMYHLKLQNEKMRKHFNSNLGEKNSILIIC